MIKSKKRGNLIIISGTTCAGKGTVIKHLLERNKNLYLSISYTSRPKRGEVEGEDYYFITPEEFQEKINHDEFLEYAQVQYGCFYGTPKKEIEEKLEVGFDVILEIDVLGAKQVKEKFPETILIFIMAPSMEEVKDELKSVKRKVRNKLLKDLRELIKKLMRLINIIMLW